MTDPPETLRARLVALRADALAQLAAGLPILDTGLMHLGADAGAVLAAIEDEAAEAEQPQPRCFAKLDKVLDRLGDDIDLALMYDSEQRDILNGRLQEAKDTLHQIAAAQREDEDTAC